MHLNSTTNQTCVLVPARGLRASRQIVSPLFCSRAKARSASSLKRGSGAPFGAYVFISCAVRKRTHCRSFRPARLTALHRGVFNPWDPSSFSPLAGGFAPGFGKVYGTGYPGLLSQAGGYRPRTPGTTVCETAGAGAAPPSHSATPAERPSGEGGYLRTSVRTDQRQPIPSCAKKRSNDAAG